MPAASFFSKSPSFSPPFLCWPRAAAIGKLRFYSAWRELPSVCGAFWPCIDRRDGSRGVVESAPFFIALYEIASTGPKTQYGGLAMKGFKQFLLRGNVVDLAVGVVIGAAFGNVVNSLVKGLLTPFIAAIVKQPDFSAISFTIHGSKFLFGDFVNSLVSFVI